MEKIKRVNIKYKGKTEKRKSSLIYTEYLKSKFLLIENLLRKIANTMRKPNEEPSHQVSQVLLCKHVIQLPR